MGRHTVPRDGFALVAVLWLLALLTALATVAAVMSVTHRRAAERMGESIRADALCDSALRVELLHLFAPATPDVQVTIGNPFGVSVPEGTAQVTLERDSGKIDLNTAPKALLYTFFASNGWTEAVSQALAERIVEWRAADPVGWGSEQQTYASAGLQYGPREAPFRSTAELRQVPGTQTLSASLLDAFTVYTHAPMPLESAATPTVLRALQYADAQQLDGHRWLPPQPSGRANSPSPPPASDSTVIASTLAGEVLTMTACAQFQNFSRCRRAVVRLTGNARKPMQIFAWRTLIRN